MPKIDLSKKQFSGRLYAIIGKKKLEVEDSTFAQEKSVVTTFKTNMTFLATQNEDTLVVRKVEIYESETDNLVGMKILPYPVTMIDGDTLNLNWTINLEINGGNAY